MLFVLSLIFSGCVGTKAPHYINIPLLGTYYKNEKVLVKEVFIKQKTRELVALPPVSVYKITDIIEDGNRFSIDKMQFYKSQKSCALKSRRIKQYENMINRGQ